MFIAALRNPMLVRTVLWLALPALAGATPNVVFMMADDLGWNDVGYHGSEIQTPNIDALVKQGVELDRYYAFPLCSPTRVALMTGRSPIRQGIDSPIGPNGGLPLDEHLLPQTLQAAGYETFMAGKWHLGIERIASHPYRRGFDRSYGHLGAAVDYFAHNWLGGLDWHRNGEVLREEGYATELITSEALDQLRTRDKSKPMFLYVAFNAPHTPLHATETYLKRYPNLDDSNRKVFAAMVSAMDDGVGKILAALKAEGIADDTLVVWVSDNGGSIRAGASNEPLRGGKSNAFEGGIRVPGVVRWTGVLTAGSKLEQQFSAHDWFQTLTSAVGVEPQNAKPFDGFDMWPALKDGTAVARDETVIGVDGNYAIFRDGWKLVEFTPRNSRQSTLHLYRIEDDPSEEHDLIEVKPDLAADLLARIRSIPRPPSVSRDLPQRGARPGAPAKAGPKAKGRGGRGPRDPRAGWPNETREPWIDTALRD